MGNSSSSQTLSSSSVNGLHIQDQQSSSCSWYNPLCSGSNSGSLTNMGHVSAPFVVGGLAAVVVLTLLTLTLIHRSRAQLVAAKQSVENKLKHFFDSSSTRRISEVELEFVNMNEIV